VECVLASSPSQDLLDLLLRSSIWDAPGNLPMIFDPEFSTPFFAFLMWLEKQVSSTHFLSFKAGHLNPDILEDL
jgi:hypothetical protein